MIFYIILIALFLGFVLLTNWLTNEVSKKLQTSREPADITTEDLFSSLKDMFELKGWSIKTGILDPKNVTMGSFSYSEETKQVIIEDAHGGRATTIFMLAYIMYVIYYTNANKNSHLKSAVYALTFLAMVLQFKWAILIGVIMIAWRAINKSLAVSGASTTTLFEINTDSREWQREVDSLKESLNITISTESALITAGYFILCNVIYDISGIVWGAML